MKFKRLTFDIRYSKNFMNFVAVFRIFKSRKQNTGRPLGFEEQSCCSCLLKGWSDVCFTGGTPCICETSQHKAAKNEG
jgi:hypothetical protein